MLHEQLKIKRISPIYNYRLVHEIFRWLRSTDDFGLRLLFRDGPLDIFGSRLGIFFPARYIFFQLKTLQDFFLPSFVCLFVLHDFFFKLCSHISPRVGKSPGNYPHSTITCSIFKFLFKLWNAVLAGSWVDGRCFTLYCPY